jgi:hypothetical protein
MSADDFNPRAHQSTHLSGGMEPVPLLQKTEQSVKEDLERQWLIEQLEKVLEELEEKQ